MKKIGQVLGLLKRNWKQLVEFEGMYKILSFFVFTPLLFGMINLSMRISGYTYLTAENFKSYCMHPVTVLMAVLLVLVMTAYSIIDISAVIYIMDRGVQRKKAEFLDICRFSLSNAKKTLRKGNWRLALFVIVMIPFLNVGLTSSYISTISIPEFIQEYIMKHWYLAAPALAGTFVMTFFLVRWMYSFHYYTLENCSFKEACKKSRDLGRGKRFFDFAALVFMQIFFALIFVLMVFAVIAGAVFLEKRMEGYRMAYAALTFVVYVVVGIFGVLLILFTVPVSYGCITVLFYYRKEQAGEPVSHIKKPSGWENERDRKKRHVLEGLVLILALAGSGSYLYLGAKGRIDLNIEYLKTMEVTAHRGASVDYPENTMAAFYGAAEEEADWIELDVQQTRDGQIIVMHDSSLKRTTGFNENIWNVDYDTIQTLEAGSFFSEEYRGEPVPLLADVIDFAKEEGIRLNIELKPTGHEKDFAETVVNLIEEAHFEQDCVVTSQEYEILSQVKACDEDIMTVYVMSMAYGNVTRLEDADAFSVEAVFVTEDLVTRVHNAGKQIYAWTVNSESSINRMISMNVDNIITDNVPLARECIYEKKNSSFLMDYVKTLLNW